MSAEAFIQIPIPRRYNIRRTVGALRMGAGDPTFRAADRVVALAFDTPDGSVTVELAHSPGMVEARLWGTGAEWIQPHLPALLGLNDRPEDFDPPEGIIADLKRRVGVWHLPRAPRLFARVIQVVALQLIQSKEGYRAWQRLTWEFGEDAPGPLGLKIGPLPEVLASVSESAIVAHGVPHKQARTMLRVAAVAADVESAADGSFAEFDGSLSRIRGIGPWTVSYVRGSALGDADAVLVGDYNLPNAVCAVLAGERRGTDDRMLELLEPYSPHRNRAIKLINSSGAKKRTRPRRPMRPVEPFRGPRS